MLPPIKIAALYAMQRAPIEGVWNGTWTDSAGNEYNTHTVGWLVQARYAQFNLQRTQVSITIAGRSYLVGCDE